MKPCLELFACAEVTLHVSVWVEMNWKFLCKRRARSRSTWACELKCFKYIIWQSELKVTLHVSVWVEILFAFFIFSPFLSRSTWACELKCCTCYSWQWGYRVTLHVSVWVEIQNLLTHVNNIFVTLHVSVWVEIVVDLFARAIAESRSTWACELKFMLIACLLCAFIVTLHVSVWVEMIYSLILPIAYLVTLHVSVWVEMF